MSHIWMSHATHLNEACHTHMSYTGMAPNGPAKSSGHIRRGDQLVAGRFHTCDMTHTYVWRDIIYTCVHHDSVLYVA